MDLQTAIQNIKQGKIAPVYFIQGQENYLIDRLEDTLVQDYLAGEKNDFNYISFDMEAVPIQDAIMEANTLSFFNEKRLIMVRQPYFLTATNKRTEIDHQTDTLLDYAMAPASDVVLVVVANYEKLDKRKKVVKKLQDHAQVVDATEMQEGQVKNYIQALIKDAHKEIAPQALAEFLKRTNYQLTQSVNELEKLLLFTGDNNTITKANVEKVVSPTLDDEVFHLTDYVITRKTEAALTLYRNLIAQKKQPIAMLALLESNFRLYTQIAQLQRLGYDQGSIAKSLKVHPYRVKITSRQMQAYPPARLMQGYMRLVELDDAIKTGKIDENLGMEWFILDFCGQAS